MNDIISIDIETDSQDLVKATRKYTTYLKFVINDDNKPIIRINIFDVIKSSWQTLSFEKDTQKNLESFIEIIKLIKSQ